MTERARAMSARLLRPLRFGRSLRIRSARISSSSTSGKFVVVSTQPERAGAAADRASFASVSEATWAGAPGELKNIWSMSSQVMPLRMPSTRTELWLM